MTESILNFLSFKHRFISDVTFNAKQRIKLQDDASAREAFNVFTDEEVRKSIIDAIDNIEKAVSNNREEIKHNDPIFRFQ